MEQLSNGLAVSLHGPEAERWIGEARAQTAEWSLELPEVEPLVIDFGLGDFRRVGEIEFWIANEVAAGYCGKFLFMFEGQTCPKHYHLEKLETFFIVHGAVSMFYDSRTHSLPRGGVLRVEAGTYHEFTAIEPTLILEVSKPSIISDNYFENRSIPIGGNAAHPG